MKSGLYDRAGASATARRRRLGELVRRPDDERVERVARVQADAGRRVLRDAAVCRLHHRARLPSGAPGAEQRGLGQRGLLGRDRRRRFLRRRQGAGRLVRHELDLHHRAIDLRERLVDEPRVVLRQPLAEHRVRHPHADQVAGLADEGTGPEPGVEAVAVDLGLDAGEDAVPDVLAVHVWPSCVARVSRTPINTISYELSPPRTACQASAQPLHRRGKRPGLSGCAGLSPPSISTVFSTTVEKCPSGAPGTFSTGARRR